MCIFKKFCYLIFSGIQISTNDNEKPFLTINYGKFGICQEKDESDYTSGYITLDSSDKHSYILLCRIQDFKCVSEKHQAIKNFKGAIFVNDTDDFDVKTGICSSNVPLCVVKSSDGKVIWEAFSNRNSLLCLIYFSSKNIPLEIHCQEGNSTIA